MKPQKDTARPTATEVARVTAEYAKFAEAGSEPLFISFPRISRIPRFNPCDDRAVPRSKSSPPASKLENSSTDGHRLEGRLLACLYPCSSVSICGFHPICSERTFLKLAANRIPIKRTRAGAPQVRCLGPQRPDRKLSTAPFRVWAASFL